MEPDKWYHRNYWLGGVIMKKKIGLIMGIVLFIGVFLTITIVYNRGNGNQEELEEEAANVGIIRVTDDNYEEEVLNTDKIVVMDFYENLCPPCTSMIPTIINISKSSDEVKVVMINMSEGNTSKLIKMYGVNASPTIIIVKDGEVKDGFVGATSEENIMSVIRKQMENKNEE